MNGRGVAMAAVAAALLTGWACSPAPPQAGTPVPDANASVPEPLPPIVLPDFSALAPAVRAQLEHAAAEFASRTAAPDAAARELADAHGELGVLLMAAGFRATAATYFLHAEAHAPGDLRWAYYLGHIYRRDGRSLEAAAAFERAVSADDTYRPALVYLGSAYLDQDRLDDAERLFSRAVALDSTLVAAIAGLGRTALARGQHRQAITHFEHVLALDPQAVAVHHPLALAYRALGEHAQAQHHLSLHDPTAGELRPPDPLDVHVPIETAVGYDVRGTRALEAGEWTLAIELLRQAVRLAPDDAAVRHKLATALAMQGDDRAARVELGEVTRRRPDFSRAHYSLGLLRLQDGDVPGALDAFRRAVTAAPTYVEARLQLAHTLRRAGDPAAAVPEYERVLDIVPGIPEARFGLAMALVATGRFARARDALAEGRRLHPDEAGFSLGLARLLAAAPDAGVRDGLRALAIIDGLPGESRRVEWGVVRGMALAEAGRWEEAVALQRAVIAALERNGSRDLAHHQSEVLDSYEQRRPRRTPWRPDEPMELPDSGIAPAPASR